MNRAHLDFCGSDAAARDLPDGVSTRAACCSVLSDFHEGGTYHPIDPDSLPARLAAAGCTDVEVRRSPLGRIAAATAT